MVYLWWKISGLKNISGPRNCSYPMSRFAVRPVWGCVTVMFLKYVSGFLSYFLYSFTMPFMAQYLATQ